MTAGSDILLSIHPRHARRIYAKLKTHEFRRVRVRALIGSYLWIYETAPVGRVTGRGVVADVLHGTQDLARFEDDVAERQAVATYLLGAKHVTALRLAEIEAFSTPISLDRLGVVRAPQSYVFIGA